MPHKAATTLKRKQRERLKGELKRKEKGERRKEKGERRKEKRERRIKEN